jgi:uncharacterized cupredoxin-like copper-binding protein
MAFGTIRAGIAISLMLTTAAAADEAFDWSGSYEGFVVCDDVTAGAGGAFGLPMSLTIVQSGDRIDAQNTVQVTPSGQASHTLFRGRVAADAAGDTVSGYLEACDATFAHKELIRIFPTATTRMPFAFAADTVFVSEAVPGEAGKLVVESCKWSLKRVATNSPDFAPCR